VPVLVMISAVIAAHRRGSVGVHFGVHVGVHVGTENELTTRPCCVLQLSGSAVPAAVTGWGDIDRVYCSFCNNCSMLLLLLSRGMLYGL
jgi:hypothetical protein